MTKNQAQFQRELLRLQRSIDKLTKQHRFAQSQPLPEQPKRVTKRMIKQLQSLKGKNFVDEIDVETGEIINQEYHPAFNVYAEILARFKQAEQEIIAQLGQTTYERDLVEARLNHIRDLIDILEYKHKQYDEQKYWGIYTAYLKQHEEQIAELLTPIIYSSDQAEIDFSFSELVGILSQHDTEIMGEETLSKLAQAEEFMMEHGGI